MKKKNGPQLVKTEGKYAIAPAEINIRGFCTRLFASYRFADRRGSEAGLRVVKFLTPHESTTCEARFARLGYGHPPAVNTSDITGNSGCTPRVVPRSGRRLSPIFRVARRTSFRADGRRVSHGNPGVEQSRSGIRESV